MYDKEEAILRAISKQKRLLIVGNGFDLAAKLPTSCEDFFRILILAQTNESSYFFKECSKKYIQTNGKIYFIENSYLNTFFAEARRINDNYFINYFIKMGELFNEWNLLESGIENIIQCFDYFLSACTCNLNDLSNPFLICDISKFADKTPFGIVEKWGEYSLKIKEEGDKDFCVFKPRSFLIGKTEFDFFDKQKMVGDFKKWIVSKTISDLNDFKYLFALYLKSFCFVPIRDVDANAPFYDCVISYNYTNAAEGWCNAGKVLHIHGRSYSDGYGTFDGTNIVIGIDASNEGIFKNKEFRQVTKFFQRQSNNSSIDKMEDGLFKDVKSVEIFGHSLDVADAETIKRIFKSTENVKKTIYFYGPDDMTRKISNLDDILGSEYVHEQIDKQKIVFENSSTLKIVLQKMK